MALLRHMARDCPLQSGLWMVSFAAKYISRGSWTVCFERFSRHRDGFVRSCFAEMEAAEGAVARECLEGDKGGFGRCATIISLYTKSSLL